MARTASQQGPEGTAVGSERPPDLGAIAARLDPGGVRREVVGELERLFRAGRLPDPPPAGPLDGGLLATTTWAPWDGFVSKVARAWMPWLGKQFDPASGTGVNRFLPTLGSRAALRTLFPSHRPIRIGPDQLEAFPFTTWVGPGKLDPDRSVLKIDYSATPNPWLIGRVLD